MRCLLGGNVTNKFFPYKVEQVAAKIYKANISIKYTPDRYFGLFGVFNTWLTSRLSAEKLLEAIY